MRMRKLRNALSPCVAAERAFVSKNALGLLGCRGSYYAAAPDMRCRIDLIIMSAVRCIPMKMLVRAPLLAVGMRMSKHGRYYGLFLAAEHTGIECLSLALLGGSGNDNTIVPDMNCNVCLYVVAAGRSMPMHVIVGAPIIRVDMRMRKLRNALSPCVAAERAFVSKNALGLLGCRGSYYAAAPDMRCRIDLIIMSAVRCIPMKMLVRAPLITVSVSMSKSGNLLRFLLAAKHAGVLDLALGLLGGSGNGLAFVPDMNCNVCLYVVAAGRSMPMHVIVGAPLIIISVSMNELGNRSQAFGITYNTLVEHFSLFFLSRSGNHRSAVPAMHGNSGLNVVVAGRCVPVNIFVGGPRILVSVSMDYSGNRLALFRVTYYAFIYLFAFLRFGRILGYLTVVPIVRGNIRPTLVRTNGCVPMRILVVAPLRGIFMLLRLSVREGLGSFLAAAAGVIVLRAVFAVCLTR